MFDRTHQTRFKVCPELEGILISNTIRDDEFQLPGQIYEAVAFKTLLNVSEARPVMTWLQANALLKIRIRLSDEHSSKLIYMREKYTPTARVLLSDLVERGRHVSAHTFCLYSSIQEGVAPNLYNFESREIASESSFQRYLNALCEFGKWK